MKQARQDVLTLVLLVLVILCAYLVATGTGDVPIQGTPYTVDQILNETKGTK
jgi:hypothetical protein